MGMVIELPNYGSEVVIRQCYDMEGGTDFIEVFETEENGDGFICNVWNEVIPDILDPDYEFQLEYLINVIDDECCLFSGG